MGMVPTRKDDEMPKFRIERHGHPDMLIDKSLVAAQSQARRLSKGTPDQIWGHSVYLILLDEDDTPQGCWTYIGEGLADKDLVADWDK